MITRENLAAQMYTLRDYLKTPADVAETVRRIKEIGYSSMQLSAIGPIDPMELKKIADDNGVKICGSHIDFGRLQNDLDNVIEEHDLWDCDFIGVGGMPVEYRDSARGIVEFAGIAEGIAQKIKAAGKIFTYHNHDFEFKEFDGVTCIDILLREAPTVSMLADTYWVAFAGLDPAEFIAARQSRIPAVHLKDLSREADGIHMAEVFEGELDWKGIVAQCGQAQWFAVEQDTCRRNPFDSMRISYNNIVREFNL